MKYYHIVSKLNGFLLDLEAQGQKPVPRIVPWKRSGSDTQLWYDDPKTGTIRNKMNNYCIDLEADLAIAKPYQEGDRNQHWDRHDDFIRNKHSHKVLDILASNMDAGAEIGPYEFNGDLNQSWDFEFIDDTPWNTAAATAPSRRFYIVSELNHLVVDVAGCHADEGTKIVTWPKNDDVQRNQLWYLDQNGYIRSDLNDMVFLNDEPGDKLKMAPFSNNPRGQWVIDSTKKRIVNRTGEALDIRGDKAGKGANLCSYEFKGTPNQLWTVQYA